MQAEIGEEMEGGRKNRNRYIRRGRNSRRDRVGEEVGEEVRNWAELK